MKILLKNFELFYLIGFCVKFYYYFLIDGVFFFENICYGED